MFYTPNPIVEEALREADGECSQATALLEGVDMRWRGNPAREKDYFRLQRLLEIVRTLYGWDGATEAVPTPKISELKSVMPTIEAWEERELDRVRVHLKRALSILTKCAETVGVSDTGVL